MAVQSTKAVMKWGKMERKLAPIIDYTYMKSVMHTSCRFLPKRYDLFYCICTPRARYVIRFLT